MRMQDIIAVKRDGGSLSNDAIRTWIRGCVDGSIPDYQSAALLMAIVLRGMDARETADLTVAMAESGARIDPGAIPGALDKHSTGGVGDKTTLVVVPLLAAAGVPICKMSGRGLGHTGGTVDKLASIPGFQLERSPEQMVSQVLEIGACLCGQSAALAPADAKLYALRDVTGTVGSLPLIVASILSKKLAGGAGTFLFDVKAGGGALMRTISEAEALARALVEASAAAGRRARALVTDMEQPLGRMVGNALEVREAIEALDPRTATNADPRLRALCRELAAEGVSLMHGLEPGDAGLVVDRVWADGSALRMFRNVVAAQGGNPAVVDNPALLPVAPVVVPVAAEVAGVVGSIDARSMGTTVVGLGGGRSRKEDTIDPRVGVEIAALVGARVAAGEPLGWVHAADRDAADAAVAAIRDAFTIGETSPAPRDIVVTRVG